MADVERVPGTFTPRTGDKGWFGNQLEAFTHMQKMGVDPLEALMAAVSGRKMTEEVAALCIASYWRRYATVANYQEQRGAAITVQAAFRGLNQRLAVAEQRESLAMRRQQQQQQQKKGSRQVRSPGSHSEFSDDDDEFRFQAVSRLQAVWRGHLARAFVERMKWQSKSKLQRTFSWSKKGSKKPSKKKAEDIFKTRTAKDILAESSFDSKPKPVKRSMSFDRFSRGVKSVSSFVAAAASSGTSAKEEAPAPASPAKSSKQLLFILLQRGPNGLGLELDATNTVVNMVPGGAAATQGYFREGDTIASVDGIPLRGRLLQDVMDRCKNSYSFDVWRLSPVKEEPPRKADKPVRRAFSFERKRK